MVNVLCAAATDFESCEVISWSRRGSLYFFSTDGPNFNDSVMLVIFEPRVDDGLLYSAGRSFVDRKNIVCCVGLGRREVHFHASVRRST